MNCISANRVVSLKNIIAAAVAIVMSFSVMPGYIAKAHANNGAAFLGGIVAGHVVGGAIRRDKIRTAAAVEEANRPRVQQAAPAPAAASTPQERLDQLNKLAAGGYITKEEYKAKKKSILDSM
jgi:hypothetical protein